MFTEQVYIKLSTQLEGHLRAGGIESRENI